MIVFQNIGNYGRLGNSLFQYATLLNCALVNSYEFGIPYKNQTPTYWVQDPQKPFQYGLEIHRCFNITAKDSSSFVPTHYFAQSGFHYTSDVLRIPDNTDIVGYFQSEKYFKENIKEVLREFTFKEEIQQRANTLISEYNPENKKLISIHVRRGDYLSYPDHNPLLGYDYYSKAINYFKNKNALFLVFSDDIQWCRGFFKQFDIDIAYVYNDTFIDMCLMSKCEHNIIANSSFSWWAAYLNKNLDKVIFAPRNYFGPGHNTLDTKDLIPEKWTKI